MLKQAGPLDELVWPRSGIILCPDCFIREIEFAFIAYNILPSIENSDKEALTSQSGYCRVTLEFPSAGFNQVSRWSWKICCKGFRVLGLLEAALLAIWSTIA